MRDPWQDDALDGLVAYLQAARGARATAWAVVVTSSEGLAAELLAELRGRVGGVEELDVSAGEDPRRIVEERLAEPRGEGFRVTVVLGSSDPLDGEDSGELLTWLNFHREDFERAEEAFVFMVSSKHADAWSKSAPDLDRYTQHFELVDWYDLVVAAERAAELTSDTGDLEVPAQLVERRLERFRGSNRRIPVALLATHVHDLLAIGAFDRARRALEEARLLVRTDTERLTVLVMSAELASRTGHPNDALAELEQADLRPDPGLLDHALGVSSFDLGQPHRARRTFDRCSRTEVKDRHIVSTSNLAEVEEWLGHIRDSHRRLSDLVSDTSSSTRDLYLPLGALASRMVDLGHPTEALDPLMRSARLSRELRREDGRTSNAVTLARATLEIGRPARSLEIVEDAATSPGWKSARSHGLAIVRAEASWILSGPSAVLPVVRDERERQRGWDAPIPAAELAYVRALASVDDDEAFRYLQDASDRFRAMDGWYYLSELERYLARLDRLRGDLDRATARIEEGLEWHAREGLRPREARDRTELAMIELGRGDPLAAHDSASKALELIQACGTRLYEPAALVALAAAELALGRPELAAAHERRWRRLVTGIDAHGLRAVLERDAAWASALAAS